MEEVRARGSSEERKWYQPILFGLLYLLVIVQAAAAALALWVVGNQSAFRFLNGFGFGQDFLVILFGVGSALVVFFPFAYAWSPGSPARRMAVLAVRLAVLVGLIIFAVLAFETGLFAVRRSGALQSDLLVLGHYLLLSLGVATSPITMRVWRGWHLVRSGSPREAISIANRRIEFLALMSVLAMAFMVANWNDQLGPPAITFVGGIVYGLVVFSFGFFFFRPKRGGVAAILFGMESLLLIGLPLGATFLFELFYGPLPGVWETALVAVAMFATLLLEALIVRQLGFRMESLGFERAPVVEKVVVDPFAD